VTDNQDVVREFYAKAINGRGASACDRLLTPDFTHNGEQRGPGGQRQAVEAFLDAFSPLHNEILIIFGQADLVCAHQRWSGKHVGEFLGHPATRREISFTSTAILQVRDGQISQAWDEMDAAGLLAQLS
jgi:predicted ester cyclase